MEQPALRLTSGDGGEWGGELSRRPNVFDFEPPDMATFRCLALAYEAGRIGGTAPAWLSAANEVAVEAFLAGRLRWHQIAEVNDAALQRYEPSADQSIDDIIAADARARVVAQEVLPV